MMYMSIVKYEIDEDTGEVKFLGGFTKPYGKSQPKKVARKLDTGDIDVEVEL